MRLTLRILNGSAAGRSHELTAPGTVLIGRSARCGLMLPSGPDGDLRVSHTHALVEFNPPVCRLYDLNSRNGTRVNELPVASVDDLTTGDVIAVGQTMIAVEINAPSEVTATFDTPPREATFDASTLRPQLLADTGVGRAKSPGKRRRCRACKREWPSPGKYLCSGCERSVAALPQVVAGYQLVKELGRGGMGVVFLAVREMDERRLAVKTFHAGESVKPAQLAKFLREADILRQLRHPHIVRFRDTGVTAGGAYLAMDYVHGLDLRQVLKRRGPFPVTAAVRAVRQALSGLAFAHGLGFIHRDLKPANLMLEVKGDRQTVKIADFGLARAYHASHLSGLTLAGEVGGTPAFLPPEQILNFREAEPTADQYAVGATLYTLLTGVHAYDFEGPVAVVLARILDEEPVPIRDRRADLPGRLARVVHKAMSRDPADRFASVADFRAALEPFAAGK